MKSKWCSGCENELPILQFSKDRSSPDGYMYHCKSCRKKANDLLRYKKNRAKCLYKARVLYVKKCYGLSEEQYRAMQDNQKGCCTICGESLLYSNTTDGNDMCIDHDHLTGKVRGLLCRVCNIGLGAFRDNPELLKNAALYLEEHNE